jgi:hypothetical protein
MTKSKSPWPASKKLSIVNVPDSARFKYKLIGFMFIFNLRKNKHLLLHDTLYMERDKRILCCCKKVRAYIGNATIVASQMLIFSAILAIYGQ